MKNIIGEEELEKPGDIKLASLRLAKLIDFIQNNIDGFPYSRDSYHLVYSLPSAPDTELQISNDLTFQRAIAGLRAPWDDDIQLQVKLINNNTVCFHFMQELSLQLTSCVDPAV